MEKKRRKKEKKELPNWEIPHNWYTIYMYFKKKKKEKNIVTNATMFKINDRK